MPKSSDEDDAGLMHSLPGIRKLEFDRVDLHQQKPRASIRIRKPPAAADAALLAQLDSSSVSHFASEQWFQHGIQKKLQKKIRMGLINIGATLDLHGYRQQKALAELEDFIQQALQTKLKFLLIIHGKGVRSQSRAKLRPMVQLWLQQHPDVLAYCPAQEKDGGYGASYVYLKNII